MTFEIGTQLTKFHQVFHGKQTRLGPGRIKQRRSVTLRQYEPIIIMIMRVLRVITHVPKEKRCDDIRGRTARSRMSAPRRRRCVDRMDPQLIGDSLKTFYVNIVHEWCKLYAPKTKLQAGFYSGSEETLTTHDDG